MSGPQAELRSLAERQAIFETAVATGYMSRADADVQIASLVQRAGQLFQYVLLASSSAPSPVYRIW